METTTLSPEDWERLADQNAAALGGRLEALQAETFPGVPPHGFRAFWDQANQLREQIRHAPAIKLEDKLALEKRLSELCRRMRQEQHAMRAHAAEIRREIEDSLSLIRETLDECETIEDTQVVRSELGALRGRITASDSGLTRADRQQLWGVWQELNTCAWERLNQHWHANEAYLASLLDAAHEAVQRGDSRAAKDRIKAFHGAAGERECAFRVLQKLRGRATAIWRQADEVGRSRHEAYLNGIRERIPRWQAQLAAEERRSAAVCQEITRLEMQAADATTGIAAALLRGQIAERRKILHDSELAMRELRGRVEDAERVLSEDRG